MVGKKNGVHIPERVKFRQRKQLYNWNIWKINVEKEKFIGGHEYLLSSLDLKLKDEDITKWTDYKEIEALLNLINATKKKNLSNIDLTIVVKLPNCISFGNRILKLMNEPEKVT